MTQRPNLKGQPAQKTLKFCSWNCKSLNQQIKWSRVLHHFQHLVSQIAFLQETHVKVSDDSGLQKGWVGQLYHSAFQSKARGAAILIHKSVPVVSSDVISDPNGRYIIVTGSIYNTKLILANVCAPNLDDNNFFHTFFSPKLSVMSSRCLVRGGDFIFWLGPLDRSSSKSSNPSNSSNVIKTFLQEFSVTDSWRFFNPTGREYSLYFPSPPYLH